MKVIILASNVFRRQRKRVAFWVIGAICACLVALPFILLAVQPGEVSVDEVAAREFAAAGCGQAAAFGLLLAVGLCQGTASYEISRSTIHLILARPVTRRQCMAGMFLGAELSALSVYLALAAVCWLGMALSLGRYLAESLAALLVMAVPVVLITSLVTLLSAWMPGYAAGLTGYAIFLFSLFSKPLERAAAALHPFWGSLVHGANLFSLRLDRMFELSGGIVNGSGLSWWPLAWELVYAIIVIVLGIWLFSYRKV